MWKTANKGGETIFLENIERWIDKSDKTVYHINYTCQMADADKLLGEWKSGQYQNLMVKLPSIIHDTSWDFILVDSPTGFSDKCPGRMQSIFMAWLLSNPKTEVFVHDCHRPVENNYTQAMFNQTIMEISTLRHLKK